MCILFIYASASRAAGKYRLIVATNRDEYFQRPAEPANKWLEDANIIGGRDLEPGREGGTWLAMSLRAGDTYKFRLGVLLNVTGEPKPPGAAGRGFIINDYLKADVTANEYVNGLRSGKQMFSGFSFVTVQLGKNTNILYYSNVDDTILEMCEPETIAAFGNSPVLTPLSKVLAGKERFANIVNEFNDTTKPNELLAQLFSLLKWNKRHLPDEELKRRAPTTVELLSSVFVNISEVGYGTRTHTIILVDWEGNVNFIEDTMRSPFDATWLKQNFIFKI